MPDSRFSSSSSTRRDVLRHACRGSFSKPLSLLLAALVLGCAEAPVASTAEVPEGCVRTLHTGSRLPVIDCSGGTTDAERRQAVSDLERVTPPKAGPKTLGKP